MDKHIFVSSMGKKKLEIDISVESLVIGVVSSLKEYKLAWIINQVLNIELVMKDDLIISNADGNKIFISNYWYQTDFFKINLIKNKGVDKEMVDYLARELKGIDYFFMIDGEDFFMKVPQVTKILKSIPDISFVQLIDVTKLKSKDNFIF